MNTTELIEIAEDVADDCIESYCGMYYQFHRDTLQQFAKRIEQPLQQRIAELENYTGHLKQNVRCEADIAEQYKQNWEQAKQQIEQLRNQIAYISEMAFLGLNTQVRKALKELCDALEQSC